jgi:signal transduction histidine kinase
MMGQSEGWNGAVEKSEFHPRREFLSLPAGAERLEVLLIAADWRVLGAAAITDFRVLRQDASGKTENICPDPKIEEGSNLNTPDGQPRYWTRGSVGARMARVLRLPPPAQGHALAITDEDIHLSPSWQTDLVLRPETRTGDTLLLEWREAFSVGTGGRQLAIFDSLPPGDYVFRVQAVTPAGERIGSETALPFTIPLAFWKRPAVISGAVAAFALAITLSVLSVTRRRLQARLDQLERRRRRERERRKIAQDIHDDLGATLTHLSLLGQTVHEKMGPTHAAWEDTDRLRALTASLTQKMDEIVWAISPRHDTVESLFSYLTDLAEEFLGAAGIRTRVHFPIQLPNWTLSPELRHDVFLATKESLNNIVKHGQATEVHLHLVIFPGAFQLTIEDNGVGFSPPPDPAAAQPRSRQHGLKGIRERIESIGGRCSIESAPGQGTRVVFKVPVDGGES